MSNHRALSFVAFFMLSAFVAAPGTARAESLTEEQMLRKAAQAPHLSSKKSNCKMTVSRDGGTETRNMDIWFKTTGNQPSQGYKLLIKISNPAKFRGTGFLTIADASKEADQWLYLPAYRKTRKIRKGNENESFLSSDFTLADLSFVHDGYYDFKFKAPQRCGSHDCHVLEGRPKSGIESDSLIYSKKILFIRKDNHINVRTEFYDPSGKLEKVMTAAKIVDLQGVPQVRLIEMKKTSGLDSTTLEFINRENDKKLDDGVFTVNFLEK